MTKQFMSRLVCDHSRSLSQVDLMDSWGNLDCSSWASMKLRVLVLVFKSCLEMFV